MQIGDVLSATKCAACFYKKERKTAVVNCVLTEVGLYIRVLCVGLVYYCFANFALQRQPVVALELVQH